MNKLRRSAFVAALAAASFSAQAYDYQYSSDTASCESVDGGRRSGTLQVVGLTSDQRLICFNEYKPGEARNSGSVSGLMSGDLLVCIDVRVQDGKLYSVTKTGGIYRLDARNAVAAKVSQLTDPLPGNSFGVDFNPAADRLRAVSNTGQNLRHDINAGGTTIVDDPLDYPPAAPVNSIGPYATGVTGSAYTNNDLAAYTATTLYALDTSLDQIARQSPPNDGTLAAMGKLGTDTMPTVGFDIYSIVRDGGTVGVQGLVSLEPATGANNFYKVNLPTGKATSGGSFSTTNKVVGIAVPLNQL